MNAQECVEKVRNGEELSLSAEKALECVKFRASDVLDGLEISNDNPGTSEYESLKSALLDILDILSRVKGSLGGPAIVTTQGRVISTGDERSGLIIVDETGRVPLLMIDEVSDDVTVNAFLHDMNGTSGIIPHCAGEEGVHEILAEMPTDPKPEMTQEEWNAEIMRRLDAGLKVDDLVSLD